MFKFIDFEKMKFKFIDFVKTKFKFKFMKNLRADSKFNPTLVTTQSLHQMRSTIARIEPVTKYLQTMRGTATNCNVSSHDYKLQRKGKTSKWFGYFLTENF